MRRVPALPPKVWTALTVLRHSTSPLPSLCALSSLFKCLRDFHLSFPNMFSFLAIFSFLCKS